MTVQFANKMVNSTSSSKRMLAHKSDITLCLRGGGKEYVFMKYGVKI